MRTVSFVLQKGGCGKTTLAGNVAHLAAEHTKTLLIDADPQGSISSWLLKEFRHELADVIQQRISLKDAMISLHESFFVLPSFGIGGDLKELAENNLERFPYCFEDIKEVAGNMGFGFIVFDVSPGLGRLERMIMLACDELVTPVAPEDFDVDGLEIFRNFLDETRKNYRRPLRHNKIVLNKMNKSFRRHQIYREKIRGLGYELFEIGQDARIPESQIMHLALAEHEPKSKVLPELRHLAAALSGGTDVKQETA